MTFSSDGQHQGRKSNKKTLSPFIAVVIQVSGYQIWTHPSISVSQFRLCAMSQKPLQNSEHLQQVGRQEWQRRAETLGFQQRQELWLVHLVLTGKTGTWDTEERGHGTKDARYWLWPFRGTPSLCDQLSVQLKGQALLKVFSLPSPNVNLCRAVLRDFTRFPAFHRNLLQTSTELWKTILMI